MTEMQEKQAQAQKQLCGQQQTLRRLVDAYEVGALELPEFTERTQQIRARIRRSEQKLEELQANLGKTIELKEVTGRLCEFTQRIRDGLDTADWTMLLSALRAARHRRTGHALGRRRLSALPGARWYPAFVAGVSLSLA